MRRRLTSMTRSESLSNEEFINQLRRSRSINNGGVDLPVMAYSIHHQWKIWLTGNGRVYPSIVEDISTRSWGVDLPAIE